MEPNGTPAAPGVSDAARRTTDAAQSVAGSAKQALQDATRKGGEQAANSSQVVAGSLRRAADDVNGEHGWIAQMLRKSADGIESAGQSLAGGDLDRITRTLNDFAHRQPPVFLGASLAMGYAIARIGKTALERTQDAGATTTGNLS